MQHISDIHPLGGVVQLRPIQLMHNSKYVYPAKVRGTHQRTRKVIRDPSLFLELGGAF
jgi:hypothetical protein